MFQFQLAAESASWPTQHMTRGCTAWWKSAGGGLCLAVVARRQISAGEELCHAYIDRGLSREQRRQTLLSKYCFACECERCAE